MAARKHEELVADLGRARDDAEPDPDIGDDVLRLAFLCCHPVLAREARVALTLREARVPFELPGARDLGERLASVLEVVYLIFNEGYTATAGTDLVRPALCNEALRLGRILQGLAHAEAGAELDRGRPPSWNA